MKFINDVEEKEKKRAESIVRQLKVSTLHKAIKQDLAKLHASARSHDYWDDWDDWP